MVALWEVWRNAEATDYAQLVIGTGTVFVVIGVLWIWVAAQNAPLWWTIPYAVALVCIGIFVALAGWSWYRKARRELRLHPRLQREF
jgi:cell division protein FtsW (lipid II flippase)